MFRKENYVIVIGKKSILHSGIMEVIEYECLLKCKKTIFADDLQQLAHRQPACSNGWYSLAVLFISHDDFFPLWFSLFLKLNAEANGNVLIFADGPELMSEKRQSLLKRLTTLDFILNPAMPEAYVIHILTMKIDSPVRSHCRCILSNREIKIIEGYVNGVSGSKQAVFFNISLKTLYHHRKNCANKLGIRNLRELLKL